MSTFAFDVVSRGLSAIATVLFIRALRVDSFAYVVLFLTFGQFAGSALTGGLRTRYIRVEAERVSRGLEEKTGFAIALGASIFLVAASAIVGLAVISVVGIEGSFEEHALLVGLVSAFTAGHASVELAMFHHQAHLSFQRAGIIGVGRGAAMMGVALAAAVGLLDSGPSIAAWLAGTVGLVGLCACLPLVRETMDGHAGSEGRFGFGPESGWLTVYYLASAGFAYANVFVVAALLDDEALASFGAATRYAAIVLGPVPALIAVLRVRTSQHDVVDSSELQASMLIGWVKRAIVPVGAGLGAAAVAAPFVIPLIDDGRYPDSIPVFQLLLVTAFVNYILLPAPNLLQSQRRYRLLALLFTVFLVVDLAAAAAAAELGGVVGVAVVVATVGAAEVFVTAYLAIRTRPPQPELVT
jgi:O-antigen/teichoic acid export membrane protein